MGGPWVETSCLLKSHGMRSFLPDLPPDICYLINGFTFDTDPLNRASPSVSPLEDIHQSTVRHRLEPLHLFDASIQKPHIRTYLDLYP